MSSPSLTRSVAVAVWMVAVLSSPTASDSHAEPRPGDSLVELCEHSSDRATVPTGREMWARWMPNLRLTAVWVPTTDNHLGRTHRGLPATPFSSTFLDENSGRFRAQFAAVWDIAELFRPVDRNRHHVRRARCRYIRRRLRRRATVGAEAHGYPGDEPANQSSE